MMDMLCAYFALCTQLRVLSSASGSDLIHKPNINTTHCIAQAFGSDRLDTGNASVLFDPGMGTGKILIQAFLQFKNLRYIFGIELSSGRYK